MGEPKVSVVTCAYTMERLQDIHEVINSVLSQTLQPHEVIVAIDHNEELFHRLKSELPPEVKVVLSDGAPGSSDTRNFGIRSSTGAIVACIDDDAVAEETWLENLVSPFEESKVMAVGGQALPLWAKEKPPPWFPEEFDFVLGCTAHKKLILQESGEVRNVTGSNMAFKKEIFQKIGFCEEKLGRCINNGVEFDAIGGEEAEICLRIKATIPDGVILYNPASVVHHKVTPERATLKYLFHYCYREGITRAMIRKLVSQYQQNPLAAEHIFLRRLLTTSIFQRLKNFYKPSQLAQIGVIMVNLSLMSTGYLLGRWRYR
jgi:cellulose synthase/poly-beta-1,6-N-acetylglucosamine synthase-like glycosyltransferase